MTDDHPTLEQIPLIVTRALWCGVVLLVLVGVAAVIGRGVFPADFATRADPVRTQVLAALHRDDPFLPQRRKQLDQFDGRFAANSVVAMLHILPGGLFLILAPLQFSSRIRTRHIKLHRWSGRILILVGLTAVLPGLYFGLRMPYGGWGEATAIAFFGGLFVVAMTRAFVAIRRHQVARHREWMIRAFAIALGISTVRVVMPVLDISLTPAGVGPPELFALSLWTGWTISLCAGELWIRYSRQRVVSLSPGAA